MNDSKITTPYSAAKYVNEELKKVDENFKPIPPQMMYNYTIARVRGGKEPFIKWDEKKGVDIESLKEWTTKYVAKRIEKANPKVEESVEG